MFAMNILDKVTFNDGGMTALKIVSADLTKNKLTVSYSASKACGTVEFTFVVNRKHPIAADSYHKIVNTELIIAARNKSTWTFELPDAFCKNWDQYPFEKLRIDAELRKDGLPRL